MGYMFQDSQWMPETMDNTESYTDNAFPYTYTPVEKFDL